jgi:hypothetical protein
VSKTAASFVFIAFQMHADNDYKRNSECTLIFKIEGSRIEGGLGMPAIRVRDDEYVTMVYYPETKILHHQIHKFFFGQTYRDIFNTGVQVFKKYGACKWLSDDKSVTSFTKEDVEWGYKEWFPRMIESGWKYWALILPEKVIGQVAVKRMAENYTSQGVQTRTFTSIDEAKKWLESCK